MNRKLALCLLSSAGALTLRSDAAFHLFTIQEIYSNPDGSVQFVELFTTFGSQQFLGGHTLRSEINAAIQGSVTFTNLPGDTTNKTFLVGTSNLVALYGITPDFVIPANFFTPGTDRFINFAEGTDRVNLTNLPTNGVSSLNGLNGNTGQTAAATSVNALATPTNFAGQTVTIPEPGAASLALIALGAGAFRRKRRRA